ncbi:hypothetical protein [Ferrimonas marina]|uniref:Uncharacterized protein n=1 Tax=Ferrimonas marina TaxID=299255 RepID=A0A1M5UI03_9GAMM|nr:hypothetical protein [Ferrimonas marina]SHH62551.1 hypothetical protein SAMN02745129_2580 [Ferrimonas marina]
MSVRKEIFGHLNEADQPGLLEVLQATGCNTVTHFERERIFEAIYEAARLNSRTTVSRMRCSDFLRMALPGGIPQKLDQTRALVEEGTPFSSLPTLDFSHDGQGKATVTSHEGRHRAKALIERYGDDAEMLVNVTSVSGGNGGAIRFDRQYDGSFDDLATRGQVLPTLLISQDGSERMRMPDSYLYPFLSKALQQEQEGRGPTLH